MSENLYDILGVPKNASQDEIKKAFRKKAKENHPDKGGDEDVFKKISSSYEILSDDEKKKNYDAYGDPKGRVQGDPYEDMAEQFRASFHTHRTVINKGENIPCVINLTLEEIKHGVKKTISYKKNILCTPCSGNGSKYGKSLTNCPLCLGSGVLGIKIGPFIERTQCHHCGGHGNFITEACEQCSGVGVIHKDMLINVDIPAGAHDEWKKRISAMGHDSILNNGIPGDLFIIIRQIPHSKFERRGDNLIYKLELSFPDIILGIKAKIPTLEGDVMFDIPSNTPIGKTFRITGKGLPSVMRNSIVGDLFVIVSTYIPESISDEEKEILEKLRKSINFI